MNWDKYSKFDIKYDQISCVVWLDQFSADDKVYITNECLHVFHVDWLDQWFNNITNQNDLKCPHWSTTITDESSKQEIKPRSQFHENDEEQMRINAHNNLEHSLSNFLPEIQEVNEFIRRINDTD